MSKWIGVDLDGTLSKIIKRDRPYQIGPPVPAMLKRVKGWLAAGIEVRILTARVGPAGTDDPRKWEAAIRRWCLQHLGRVLPVTASKDCEMSALWDDKAVQVTPNRGERVDGCQ